MLSNFLHLISPLSSSVCPATFIRNRLFVTLMLLGAVSSSPAAKGYILTPDGNFTDRTWMEGMAKFWDYELVSGNKLPGNSGRNVVLFASSAGAGAFANLVKADPDRIVAFCPFVLGTPNFGEAVSKQVAHLALIGSQDGSQYEAAKTRWSGGNRSNGLYGWAVMWGAGHVMSHGMGLAMLHFDHMIRGGNRDESKGWLGDFTTMEKKESGEAAYIADFASYKGDKNKAVWLTNRYMAYAWRAQVVFDGSRVQTGGNTTVVPPITISGPNDTRVGAVGELADVGSDIAVSVLVHKSEIRKLEICHGDNVLRTIENVTPGGYTAVWKNVPEGVHGILAVGYGDDGKVYSSPLNVIYAIKGQKGTIPHFKEGGSQKPAGAPELTAVTVGKETDKFTWPVSPTVLGTWGNNGDYELTGHGVGVYWCWDRMPFGHVSVTEDFVFSARLKRLPKTGPGLQVASAGIAIKAGLSTKDPVLSLRWDTHWENTSSTGLSWFNRITQSNRIALASNGEKGEKLGQGADECWEGCLGEGYENRVEGFKERDDVYIAVQRKNLTQYHLYARYGKDSQWKRVEPVSAGRAPWNWGCGANPNTRPHFEVPGTAANRVYAGLFVAAVGDNYSDTAASALFDQIQMVVGQESHAFDGGTTSLLPQTASAWQANAPQLEAGWFRARAGQRVRLEAFDLSGRPMELLFDGVTDGTATHAVSSEALGKGIRMLRLVTPEGTLTRRIALP